MGQIAAGQLQDLAEKAAALFALMWREGLSEVDQAVTSQLLACSHTNIFGNAMLGSASHRSDEHELNGSTD